MSTSRSAHYTIVLRIFHYVKGTPLHGLYFLIHLFLEFRTYSDADWADNFIDHRSTTDFFFFL